MSLSHFNYQGYVILIKKVEIYNLCHYFLKKTALDIIFSLNDLQISATEPYLCGKVLIMDSISLKDRELFRCSISSFVALINYVCQHSSLFHPKYQNYWQKFVIVFPDLSICEFYNDTNSFIPILVICLSLLFISWSVLVKIMDFINYFKKLSGFVHLLCSWFFISMWIVS